MVITRAARIGVALVDDHRLLRDGLIAILSTAPEIEVVAQGATSEDAIEIAANYPVTVMVLDVELRGEPTTVTVRRLLRIRPSLAVVVLTMFDDEILRREMLRAGRRT